MRPASRAAKRILDARARAHRRRSRRRLISGGGSALLALPAPGLTLDDKQRVNRALLACGATIGEMNCVRQHLSAIKGGRLAAACHPARVVTLLMSDVPGDDPVDIASGPTVADPTTCADALDIVRRYGIELPATVRRVLESGDGETVKPGDPRLARAETRMIATPQLALEAAARVARAAGVAPAILGDAIEGEARDVGKVMAGIALHVAARRAVRAALRAALRRRDHGHGARRRARRPQRRVPARARASRSTASPASTRSPATPTASTARRRSPARSSRPTRSRARGRGHSSRPTASPATTVTASSARSAMPVVTGPTFTNVNDFRAILVTRHDPQS